MRALTQSVVLGIALALLTGGCAVMATTRPLLNATQLQERPPRTIAVLPFHNESKEPLAAGVARDAAYYALADRGYRLLSVHAVDKKMEDSTVAASLRRPDGGINADAAGRVFGADAVVVGRVYRAGESDFWLFGLARLRIQLWMVDTRTGQTIWTDTGSGYVRLANPLRRPKTLTPAEREQAPQLQLCRAFDAMLQRMAKSIPSIVREPALSQLAISRLDVRVPGPVVPAGDPIEILAEGTPGCVAIATLGTLGTTMTLEESAGRATGVYHGTYTVQPGDYSNYCRVAVTLQAGANSCRRAADVKSAFVVDAVPPLSPTHLTYETQPSGVLLRWDSSPSPDVANYMVFRSDATSGGVRLLSRPSETSCLDRIGDDAASRAARHSVYFVKAVDVAGNSSSPTAPLAFDLPARGPSTAGGVIQGETRWTAFGGPYRLVVDVDVAPGGCLIIEPGTQVEIPPGMEITVRGTVEAVGRAESPIRVIGTESSRGFHVANPGAVLRASYVEISGAARAGIEAADGECYLEQVTLRQNRVGLDAQGVKRLVMTRCTFAQNRYGVIGGANCEVQGCAFTQNDVGLRVVSEGIALSRCQFQNTRLDVEKLGGGPLQVDGNMFWTSDPSKLFQHLWGNVVCRKILVKGTMGGANPVQFEPVTVSLGRAAKAEFDSQWEEALRAYETALLQERNRDIVEKVLKLYKQLVETEGPAAIAREIEFCQSAVLTYPNDLNLLHHLADLYYRQGNSRMAREIYVRILKINPNDETAKKNLAAAAPNP